MKRKTAKEILTASFQELAAVKSIDKITIQEIVDNCGYSPATFYRYKEQILEAMRKAGKPLNAGKVAELIGLDRKAVDKAFAEMKKEGSIVSPVRCKWEPADTNV